MQVAMGSLFGLALAKNRQLVEDVIYMQRRQAFEPRWTPSEPGPAVADTGADAAPTEPTPVRSER
jgi:hypothetical protein